MNTDLASKLIDLYLDGHLDLDLVRDFREAVRNDSGLAHEVESLRNTREFLLNVYGKDAMSHDENRRVYQRIMRSADPSGRSLQNPAGQLEIPWSNVTANDHRL
jgi:hypothetical protein